MEELYPLFGDLYKVDALSPEVTGLVCIFASVLCGAVVGMERERRDKPAGMRTVILIAVGSTIFTMASIHLAQTKEMADPARIASQIAPGIGFLGAGAIIQMRGSIHGLTTGATIWAVAAVGIFVGAGYVAAGLGFTAIIFVTLSVFRRLETFVVGSCDHRPVTVRYRVDNGKTRHRLQAILDEYQVPDEATRFSGAAEEVEADLTFRYCGVHRYHRRVLKDMAEMEAVTALKAEG